MVVSRDAHGVRVYLLRHGEPARRDLFYGTYDIDLSEQGLRQAEGQARCLARVPFVALFSSDLQRATKGAQLIADACGGTVQTDPALREMDLGHLEQLPHAEAMQRYPQWAGRSYFDMLDARMPGGGESVRDLAERVLPCLRRIASEHAGPRAQGRWPTVLVYAHNTVARVVLAQAAGAGVAGYPRFTQRYGAINRLDLPVISAEPSGAGARRIDWDHATIGYTNRDPLAPTPDRG